MVVLVISLVLAVAWWHKAWENPTSTQIGGAGDADEYSWFFSWMPFAIGHGLNPLVSNFVNFPNGVNLMWNTSVLLPSFLLAPVTVALGAAFSYNLTLTLAPALACTFCYLAFRRWTGRLPAVAGSLVLGFSPYVASQSVGHLAQVLIASAPLFLVLFDRLLVVQSAKPWREGLLLGLLAWAQLLTGEEVLAMEALIALAAVAVLCVVNRGQISAHFRYAWSGLKVAGGLFIVLAAPFLAFQYLGPDRVQNVHPPDTYVSDLLNFVVPTNITRLAPASVLQVSQHFTGNGSEQGAYIGIPLLIFIGITVFLARRRRVTWVALTIVVSAGLLSMGSTLHVDGRRHFMSFVRLPDWLLQKLPFFHNLLPDRFTSVMFLGVGLLLALGLEELHRLNLPLRVDGDRPGRDRPGLSVPDRQLPRFGQPSVQRLRHRLGVPGPAVGGGDGPRPGGPDAAGQRRARPSLAGRVQVLLRHAQRYGDDGHQLGRYSPVAPVADGRRPRRAHARHHPGRPGAGRRRPQLTGRLRDRRTAGVPRHPVVDPARPGRNGRLGPAAVGPGPRAEP